MEILWEIYNNAKIDDTRIDQKVQFLETLCMPSSPNNQVTADDVIKSYEDLPSPRLLKTHLHYEWVPQGEGEDDNPRIVLLIRNPKDCVVSYYHHYTGFGILECDCEWDEFFELFIDGRRKYIR